MKVTIDISEKEYRILDVLSDKILDWTWHDTMVDNSLSPFDAIHIANFVLKLYNTVNAEFQKEERED